MSALVQVHAQSLLDASLGTATFVATVTPLKLRLIGTNGSQSTAGTEITAGGSYVAGGSTVTYTAATTQTGTFSAQATNNAWSQTNMPVATVNGVEEWDSAGTPLRKWWGALTVAKTTALGDTLSFPAASLTNSI